MADYYGNETPPIESPGLYYPQDFYLKSLNLLVANGNKIELRKVAREISYYEDIYTFVVSGYIKIEDSQGLLESLQLTGNEYLEVNFNKIKNGPSINDQIFRVYKVGDRIPSSNLNTQYYTLYFCSEELVLSEQIKMSKSYKGTQISEMVSDILTNVLKTNKKNINVIEETSGMYDFVVPKMKPLEAISWLSTYARPAATGALGADMLFFETRDGYNFRSLQSMFQDNVYATYKYQQKNLGEKEEPTQEKVTTVLNYEVTKNHDVIHDISSGSFANRLISIDPITRSHKVTDFKYDDYKERYNSLNGNGVINNLQNRLQQTLSDSTESVLKLLVGNSGQADNPYIKSKEGGFAKDIFVETYIPQRTAQLNLANYNVLKLAIPGDSGITAGKVIEFNLMNIKPTTKQRELDKFYSGKYLVTAVRHVIQPINSTYQTILEIAKESSKTPYADVDNGNINIKQNINA